MDFSRYAGIPLSVYRSGIYRVPKLITVEVNPPTYKEQYEPASKQVDVYTFSRSNYGNIWNEI